MEQELVQRGYRKDWETMIEKEFRRLKGTEDKERVVYLDSAGASLYSQSQVEKLSEMLSHKVLRNPHSASAEDPRDALRKRCLAHCNASVEDYVCVLTSSATSSIHTAVQLIPWKEGDLYLYTRACHTSLMGARNIVLERGACAYPVELSCKASTCNTDVVDDKDLACSFEENGKLGGKTAQTDALGQKTQASESKYTGDGQHVGSTLHDTPHQQFTAGQTCTTGRHQCTKHWSLCIDNLALRRDTAAVLPSSSTNCRQESGAASTASDLCYSMHDSLKDIRDSSVVLLALPHECNVSGFRTDLAVIDAAHKGSLVPGPNRACVLESRNSNEEGHDTVNPQSTSMRETGAVGNTIVLLDAARSGGTLPPDVGRHKADFVVLSFYKIFGLPTSGGALLIRKKILHKLQRSACFSHKERAVCNISSRPGTQECLQMEAKVQRHSKRPQRAAKIPCTVPKGSKSLFLKSRSQPCLACGNGNKNDAHQSAASSSQGCRPQFASTADIMLSDKCIRSNHSVPAAGDVAAWKKDATFAHMAFGGGSLLACTPDRDCAIRQPVPEGLEGGSPDFLGHQAALIGFQHLDALGGSLALYQHAMALRNYALEYMSHLVHPVSRHPVFVLYGVDDWLRQAQLPRHLVSGYVGQETRNSVLMKNFGTHRALGGDGRSMRVSGVDEDNGQTFELYECGAEASKSSFIKPNAPFQQHPSPLTGMETDDDYPYGPTIAFNIFQSDGTLVGHNQVIFLAELNNIYLRGGRFCNPGAASKYWQVDLEELVAGCTSGLDCKSGGVDFVDGVPTGALRISFGYYNTVADLTEFFSFVEKNFLLNSSEETKKEGKHSLPLSTAIPSVSDKTKVTIKKIILYPIKSCSGQEVSQWYCKPGRGLLFDREWMLVDALGKPLSSKSVPKMKAVVPFVDLEKNTLFIRVDHRASNGLSICTLAVLLHSDGAPVTPKGGKPPLESLLMTDDVVYARHEDDPVVLEWFKKVVGEEIRLARASHDCTSSFANRGDLHLISQQSLLDLEEKMNAYSKSKPQCSKQTLSWQNFRPNLVIDGNFAYEEDKAQSYVLSEGKELQLEAPCTRCSGVNIGKNSKEPLYTLTQYRRNKSGVAFGVLLSFQDSLGQEAQSTVVNIGQVLKAIHR